MKSKMIMGMLFTSILSVPSVYAAQKSSSHTTHSAHSKCGSCTTEEQEASPTPVPTPVNSFLNQQDLVENDSLVARIMSFLTWRFRKDERLFQLGICTGQNLSQNGITIPLNQPLSQEQINQVQTAKQTCFQQLNPTPTPSPSPSPSPTVSPSPTATPVVSVTPTPIPTVTPVPSFTPVPSPSLAPTPSPGSI